MRNAIMYLGIFKKTVLPGMIRLFKYLTKDIWNLSGASKLEASRIVK
jgi:hypothetical protein